jgi:hypothetical protein
MFKEQYKNYVFDMRVSNEFNPLFERISRIFVLSFNCEEADTSN